MKQKQSESALKAFLNDHLEGGVSVEHLKQLLEEELSKESSQIDTAYVDELVYLICEHNAPIRSIPRRRHRIQNSKLRRSIAGIAALVVLVGTLSGIAQAWSKFKVTFFAAPDAEQIKWQVNSDNSFSDNKIESNSLPNSEESVLISPLHSASKYIFDENSLPQVLNTHPVIRLSADDGYRLDSAILFNDSSQLILQQTYDTLNGEINIQMIVYFEQLGNTIINMEHSQQLSETNDAYFFEDHDVHSVCLPFDSGYHLIWGTVSKDEILTIFQQWKGVIS